MHLPCLAASASNRRSPWLQPPLHAPCAALVLLGGCNAVVALGLWLLYRYRRGTYIAHREACCVLGYVPVVLFAAVQQSERRCGWTAAFS